MSRLPNGHPRLNGHPQQPSPTAQAALQYIQLGFSVLPLCPPDHRGMTPQHTQNCQHPGKVPIGNWRAAQQTRMTEPEAQAIWNRQPYLNVGVATGEVSRLTALDLDSREGESWLMSQINNSTTPTWCYSSGRVNDDDGFERYRVLYLLPEGFRARTRHIHNAQNQAIVSFMANGSQVVMPPSRHESGNTLAWYPNRGPDDLPLAEAPPWLLNWLLHGPPGRQGQQRAQSQHHPEAAGEVIPPGGRDNALLRIGCAVRRQGFTQPEIAEVLEIARRRCGSDASHPPVSDRDVERLARQAAQYAPREVPPERDLHRVLLSQDAPLALDLSEVNPLAWEWLWPGYIPAGTLSCTDGEGGTGKSAMWLDLAARLTRGDCMPDGSRGHFQGPVGVVIVNCEDDPQRTIVPRLLAANADMRLVRILNEVTSPGGQPKQFVLPDNAPALEAVIRSINARLALFDPATQFLSKGYDFNKDPDVRAVLLPLLQMAARTGCAVHLIKHFNKQVSLGRANARASGAGAWTTFPRLAYVVGNDPQDPDTKVFACHKPNIAVSPRSQGYRLVGARVGEEEIEVARVIWTGPSNLTADDLAAPPPAPGEGQRTQDALTMLEGLLGQRPYAYAELRALAREHGVGETALQAARRRLHATTSLNDRGQTVWSLPAPEEPAEEPHDEEDEAPETAEEA